MGAGAGVVETLHRYQHITYEQAVHTLDTATGDTPEAVLAQQRLKALVSVALATLARQAASGGELGFDAARFLETVRKELGR